MENENDILSKIPSDIPVGPYLLGYAQAVHDLNKDWDSFRREVAKEILAGILSHPRILYNESLRPEHVRMAISYTDELIKQLKEGEK